MLGSLIQNQEILCRVKKFMENAEDWQAGHYIYITAGNEIDEVEYLRESATVTVFDGNMDLQG